MGSLGAPPLEMRKPPWRWPTDSQKILLEKRPGSDTLPNRNGCTTALELRAHLNPLKSPRATPIREILSLSLRVRIGIFGSAAATNCASPRGDGPSFSRLKEKRPAGKTPSPRGLEHFVVAALPEIPIRARKLGYRISSTDVARGQVAGFRHAHSFSAMATPARFWGGGRLAMALWSRQNTSAKANGHFRYFCPSRIDPNL
jgi:hypothetical protein